MKKFKEYLKILKRERFGTFLKKLFSKKNLPITTKKTCIFLTLITLFTICSLLTIPFMFLFEPIWINRGFMFALFLGLSFGLASLSVLGIGFCIVLTYLFLYCIISPWFKDALSDTKAHYIKFGESEETIMEIEEDEFKEYKNMHNENNKETRKEEFKMVDNPNYVDNEDEEDDNKKDENLDVDMNMKIVELKNL